MTTEASATTEDEKQQRAPGPAVNNYKIDFAANVSARDASVIASISLQFSVPLDTLRKPLLIQLPTCGRGRGRCEAVMEADFRRQFFTLR